MGLGQGILRAVNSPYFFSFLVQGKIALVKMYRAAQQWQQWLTESLGSNLLETEKNFLFNSLAAYFGKHTVLIGVPNQHSLLKASVTAYQTLLTPLTSKLAEIKVIESDFHELPIASGVVDLVILPHSLEYLDNPRQLLNEACRVVKPEGHIIILGFNPVSLWGLKKAMTRKKNTPWKNDFILARTVIKWLKLADFELVKQTYILHRPPVRNHSMYARFKIFDLLGQKIFQPLGGVYILVAKAKVVSLTPIRLRWKQTFSSVRVSMPGPSMRQF